MGVFDHKDFDGHEDVVFCHDESVGLRAIIAIHSTALGPAAGGCRMMPYASVDEALTDVLRLSKGMTYKSALAGLPLGGGKSVIIADPASPQKADVLRAFGRHVQALGGRYWTASTSVSAPRTSTSWRRPATTSSLAPASTRLVSIPPTTRLSVA